MLYSFMYSWPNSPSHFLGLAAEVKKIQSLGDDESNFHSRIATLTSAAPFTKYIDYFLSFEQKEMQLAIMFMVHTFHLTVNFSRTKCLFSTNVKANRKIFSIKLLGSSLPCHTPPPHPPLYFSANNMRSNPSPAVSA